MLLGLMAASCAARGQTDAPVSLFDPARHMHVSEVKPGMKGYGLSVFEGSRIDRFDVEVVSVLHNFNPKYDVVLIRCSGANLEHTGPIAGMSGSPIYLTDEQGRSRMIGAFAYGWSLMKDPLAGVQPIEYMLEVGSTLKPSATQQASGAAAPSVPGGTIHYIYDPFASPFQPVSQMANSRSGDLTSLNSSQLRPMATPLMAGGLSPKLIDQLGPLFKSEGLVLLQAGASTGPTTESVNIEPGSVLAAPLLRGDASMTALGTCTEVIGNRVFGFGHPFNNEGPITLPMSSGRVNAIIATLSQSFKIGATAQMVGTLIADQSVGVAGELGKVPPAVPIDVRVIYTDGSADIPYHFEASWHSRLTPAISAAAITAAMTGRRELPQYHTVEYDLTLEFADSRTVKMSNVVVNSADVALVTGLATPLKFATENPFGHSVLKKITGTLRVTPEAREAEILSVSVPKMKYAPGETLHAFVRCRPFRAPERVIPIDLPLPHDLRDGTYKLNISDQHGYIEQEEEARAFRFSTESLDDVFAVLNDVTSIREDALYVRLVRQADGVAVGRTALPRLPGSRRQILLDAGLSNITPYVSTAAKIVPTGLVMDGSADFDINIESGEHPENGATPAPPVKSTNSSPRPSTPRSPLGLPIEGD